MLQLILWRRIKISLKINVQVKQIFRFRFISTQSTAVKNHIMITEKPGKVKFSLLKSLLNHKDNEKRNTGESLCR